MVDDPGATPVTGTLALVALAAKVTLVGTVAAAALLEVRLNVNPEAGAGTDKLSARLCVAVPVMVAVEGEKLMLAPTFTGWLDDPNPGADAVIVALPKLTPVTCGCVAGVVDPWAMKTLAGDIETVVRKNGLNSLDVIEALNQAAFGPKADTENASKQ